MSPKRKKKSRERKPTGVVADVAPAEVVIIPGFRFLSHEERAKRFSVLADAIKSNRERDEARLSDLVMQLKTGLRP
jgi:hypothetical protein